MSKEDQDFYDSSPSKHKKYGSRYDSGTANSIDVERRKSEATGVFLDYKAFRCTRCNERKPRKGGTNKNNKFVCSDCAKGKIK